MISIDLETVKRKTHRKKMLAILAGVLLLVVIIAVVFKPKPDDTVWGVASRRTIVSRVTATGSVVLQPAAEVTVGAQTSGTVRRIYIQEGDRVKAGQLVAEIDGSEARLMLHQAEASASAARARLAQARSQERQAARDAERSLYLFREGALSKAEYEAAASRHSASRSEVAAAGAAVEQAASEAARQRTNLAKTALRSPIDGTVLEVEAREGESIAAGFTTPSLLRIGDLKRFQIEVPVDETDVAKIAVGQNALVTVDSYPDRKIDARVVSIATAADNNSGVVAYPVIVRISDESMRELKPRMTATVDIEVSEMKGILSVPLEAIRSLDERSVVYIEKRPSKGRRYLPVTVKTGINDERYVAILSGLKEGDRVVLSSRKLEKQIASEEEKK